jgi:hypothetical protein
VLNLISNAVRFTEPGGLISLSVEILDGKACISVSDNGCGMGAQQIAKLFQRFSSGEPDTQSHVGSGLGLSVVKSFIERMNGYIEIESERGEGTCARLFLPLKSDAHGSGMPIEPPSASAAHTEVELAELMEPLAPMDAATPAKPVEPFAPTETTIPINSTIPIKPTSHIKRTKPKE